VIDPSRLADRLRAVVAPKGPAAVDSATGLAGAELARPSPPNIEQALGGEWQTDESGRWFVIERRFEPETKYGRQTIGDLSVQLERAASQAPMLCAGAPARTPFVFLDLETTGLSGGAGTYAFVVGSAVFASDGAFVTRQFLLPAFADERAMLQRIALELSRAGALVSFNGKSFDAPVLETRYLFHRLDWIGSRLPHVDVLHPSRRFWASRDDERSGALAWAESSCSLIALERQVLGARRRGDVAGFEIPSRYFQFVRSGDPRPLVPVFEHNRLDLLSLAGLTARLLHLLGSGPQAACDAREALALGRTYARAGFNSHAIDAYRRAVAISPPPGRGLNLVQIEILRSLAAAYRRVRRFDDAAATWRLLLEMPGCAGSVAREATEALAIHHEHRVRDLQAAKTFALKSLHEEARPRWNDAVRHRLARIERKITVEEESRVLPMASVW